MVFVVEDDEAMRESLEFLLGSVGLEVLSFASAEAFLEAYDPTQSGCLLTDVRMPGMGGLALHEELRRRGLQIPVVVMTAYADVPMVVRVMRGGAVDFIEKPFNDQALLDCLKRALEQDHHQRFGLYSATPTGVTPQTPTQYSSAYPPVQVAQYRIVRRLGSGGMSEVFLAEDMELNRLVALKVLQLHGTDIEHYRTRFRQEARAVAALNHPNIVTIFQILEQQDHLCIAMEYVEGKTLRVLIEEGELSVERTVEIVTQVCEGLMEAHRIGIIHRDVKPENIIVDTRGRASLLDFGIASRKSSPRITGEGKMIGTPSYMSPEQALGEEAGPPSDVFAVGVMLYEALVGETPFQGANPLYILKAILTDPMKPFPEDRPDLPEALRDVVYKALDKDLAGRYPDCAALRSDLLTVRQAISLWPTCRAFTR